MDIVFVRILILSALSVLTLTSCAKSRESVPAKPDGRVSQLVERYGQVVAELDAIRQPNGWPTNDCDGMIWAGRDAIAEPEKVNILLAEYPDQPGRFKRRPELVCEITWSRDMGIAGVIPYAFLTGQRDILERHAAYGVANNWWMGNHADDGRDFYTPAMVGLLYKAIFALGGESSPRALWPSIYPSGLDDYQLHLEVMDIFLHGRIADKLGEKDQKPQLGASLTISDTMYQVLEYAVTKEPNDPLYAYILGEYSGDLSPAVSLLLDPAEPVGGYVRCDGGDGCKKAHWIFAAFLTLERLGAKPSQEPADH